MGAGFLSALMLHPFIRWLGRRCLRWFYRERCFVGLERIPSHGPVLLIGNHPNDLPDVLAGFLTTTRPLRYVATISGAASAPARAAYRGLGVIPVTRVRDARRMREQGVDAAAMNADAFRRVSDALREGAVVGVFPEGGVHDGPSLGHFRAGVSKMALESAVDAGVRDLVVLAFGVHYDAPRTVRSDMTVVVGAPFVVQDWLAAPGALDSVGTDARAPARLALAMRHRMQDALLAVTRNARSWEDAAARDRISATVAAVITEPRTSLRVVAADVARELDRGGVPDESVGEHARLIAAAVAHAGGIATSPRDCARVLDAAGRRGGVPLWPSITRTTVATPIALLGWLTHGPAFAGIWRMAQRTAQDRAQIVARAFVPGVYLILCWYLLLTVGAAVTLATAGRPLWLAIPLLVLLPRLGDIAVAWRDALAAWRLRFRVRRWSAADRAALCTAADALRIAWLSHESSAAVKAVAQESTLESAQESAQESAKESGKESGKESA